MSRIFSYLPKRTLVAAFGVIMALSMAAVAFAVADWGPDRPIKHWLGDGTAGFDHVTLNSFVDVPYNIGDERDFTRGMVIGRDSATADPVADAKANDVLYVTMWVHNGADPSLNASGEGIAKNLTARVSIPTAEGTTHKITGYLNADNVAPAGPYWDTVTINTTGNTVLEFVPGSATIKTNALDYVSLNDNIFTNGTLIGDNALDGDMPGCFEYGAWVNFRVKVVEVQEPIMRCDSLEAIQLSRTDYKFVAQATAQNGATIDKYVFNFGDSQTANVVTDATTANATHSYAAAGTYNAKVTIWFTADGQTHKKDCAVNVTVEQAPVTPVYKCNSLVIDKLTAARTVRATVNASGEPADRVHITGYNFNFGDSYSTDSTINVREHTYATDGTFNLVATVKFSVDGQLKTATCINSVTFTPIVTPPALPNTGPASVFGTIFGTSVLGIAIGGFLKSRRELRSTFLG